MTARVAPILLASLAALGACAAPVDAAENYPSAPIRILAGTAPGGQSDRLARLVAQHLGEILGQPITVENRAGADGMIAAEAVAQAAPDGHTLLVAGQSALVLVAALGRNARYDPVADFAPIGRIARVPLVLAASASVPAKTLPDLLALARARPGALSYGTSGMVAQFAGRLLQAGARIELLEIPYKSVPMGLQDLLAGRIDLMFFDLSLVAAHAKGGQLRLLAAAGSHRASAAPELPTLLELGASTAAVEPWFGVVAPKATAPDVLARLRGAFAEMRRLPEVRRQLEQFGYEPIDDTPERFAADMQTDIARYSAIAREAGLKGGQ
jgi:tripartite-type tricarboxylate transporter receptor subunit TctC